MDDIEKYAVVVHKYLKCKYLAKINNLKFSLYNSFFILKSENYKHLFISENLTEMEHFIIEYIDKHNGNDFGFYCS